MINLQSLYTNITVRSNEIERVNKVEFKTILWTGLIVWGETTKGYVVLVNFAKETYSCTCKNFQYTKSENHKKKACKHVKKLFMECWKNE